MGQKDVIHSSLDKLHVAVQYTRWTADHQPIAIYQALWVVTCVQRHWGVQVRSRQRCLSGKCCDVHNRLVVRAYG
jgi:hypothetical protein